MNPVSRFTTAAMAAMLAMTATVALATVPVDQTPLIGENSLPSNVVLMLDDSGSMSWNFMPDICYLQGVKCDSSNVDLISVNNDALIDSANNGLYYNPTTTYTPPPQVSGGTLYPASPGLTTAWVSGLASTKTEYDLTNYNGAGECYYTSKGGLACGKSNIAFSTSIKQTSGKTYNYFQYSLGPAAGAYTDYYVAATDCGGQANCVIASDTSGAAAPVGIAAGQNVANWFSYYHTRILMAQSGLLTAFANVGPGYRVGFGSIDGNNATGLPSSTYSYADAYNGKTGYIANVMPFGDGTSSTDQRTAFWKWVLGETAGGGTPLRQALDQVGQYYQSGQPWTTMSSDPNYKKYSGVELSCRQSYTILTTDGFWNDNFSSSAEGADDAKGPVLPYPNVTPAQNYQYLPVAPYEDSFSGVTSLADVAMNYWETDLRPTTANEVPTNSQDWAFWQHMTTFTMGLGFTPEGITPSNITVPEIFAWADTTYAAPPMIASPTPPTLTPPISTSNPFAWPKPASNSINNIADLAHAGVNGHGGFYSATSPQSFTSGLESALGRASALPGSSSSLAANSTQLQAGDFVYQASYQTSVWTGDLQAYGVDATSGAINASSTWSAAAQLKALANAGTTSTRSIYTYNPSAAAGSQYVAFQLPSSLSSVEQSALGANATAQQNVISYLRGDSTMEQKNQGGIYRSRTTPLGDIVDSAPVYVGSPSSMTFSNETFTGSSTYTAYVATESSRTATLYAAANDGMLHAFNASTGAESWAYIPAATITSGLQTLSNPDYGLPDAPHQFFNDGQLTVADAYYNKAWHTVAVGTTGRGPAKAVYAFDITDPTKIQFLWERSAGDGLTNSNYIGEIVGQPIIAQTADDSWSVLIGNGYNSTQNTAALLQFDLTTGTLGVYTTDTSVNNGLAAPAVWIGTLSNGISTTAYAGDLLGRVWSFPLTATGTTASVLGAGTSLFTTSDGTNAQPITAGMLAGKDPATGNVWVFFGTGQYLTATDLNSTNIQTWYGLIVQSSTSSLVSNLSSGLSSLVNQTILSEIDTATLPALPSRTLSSNTATGKSGWYMKLVSPPLGQQGERMVVPNQFEGSVLLGISSIPVITDPCSPGGSGWIMAVNPFTGTQPAAPFFNVDGGVSSIGLTASPNGPTFIGSTLELSEGNGGRTNVPTNGGGANVSRGAWRELITP